MPINALWERFVEDEGCWDCNVKELAPPRPRKIDADRCRKLCQQNLCKCYGTTWACPPGAGTTGQCQATLKNYRHAFALFRRYIVDTKDADALREISSRHQDIIRGFSNRLRYMGYATLPLADGGCNYCDFCAYPEPCLHPDQLVPSISAYGIMLVEYLEDQGISFEFEQDAATLYGLILYNEPSELPISK